jgi:ParB family chromosome partitioning protein
VAMEIAKVDSAEAQRELLQAYEKKELTQVSIRTVKRLIEQRRLLGKDRSTDRRTRRNKTSAESLLNVYRRESARQKIAVKKAKICEAKLVFIVSAFDKLLGDENFTNLLRAESLFTMPKYLWAKLSTKHKEAA